jgi:hypothetical protein
MVAVIVAIGIAAAILVDRRWFARRHAVSGLPDDGTS